MAVETRVLNPECVEDLSKCWRDVMGAATTELSLRANGRGSQTPREDGPPRKYLAVVTEDCLRRPSLRAMRGRSTSFAPICWVTPNPPWSHAAAASRVPEIRRPWSARREPKTPAYRWPS